MRYVSIAFVLLFACGLIGCGQSEPEKPATPAPAENGAMNDAMDKGAAALGDVADNAANAVKTAFKVEDAPAGSTPVNSVCPMSGKPLNADAHMVTFQGKTYGFCCNDCYTTAKDAPEKLASKLGVKN